MKKPNQFLKKKYISSLVIAAFMILTMLTAYNIRIGKEDTGVEKTEVKETIGDSDDVISSGNARTDEADNGTTDNSAAENNLTDDAAGNNITQDDSTEDATENNSTQDDSTEDAMENNNTQDDSTEDATENKTMQDDSTDDITENKTAIDDSTDRNSTKNDTTDDKADNDITNTADNDKTNDTTMGNNSAESNATENYSYDGKEKLSWPLVGNIILPYSMDTTVYYTTLDQYACNDGILISAKKGSPVTAVADGRIVNIYQSDKYGTTITLLIGQSFEVSYSQVENVKYEVGDEVKSGDMIASVAEPTRFFTLEGPHLFFKMTCEGEAVNPTDYLET